MKKKIQKNYSDEFLEVLSEAYKRETDPLAIIVTHSYLFSDMNLNDLRSVVLVSDSFGEMRLPSKEFIRRLIGSIKRHITDIIKEKGIEDTFTIFSDEDNDYHSTKFISLPEDQLEPEQDDDFTEKENDALLLN